MESEKLYKREEKEDFRISLKQNEFYGLSFHKIHLQKEIEELKIIFIIHPHPRKKYLRSEYCNVFARPALFHLSGIL